MQHKVEICGVNTSKLKVLKNEETRALLLRAKEGDQQAREELISGNLRLVLSWTLPWLTNAVLWTR